MNSLKTDYRKLLQNTFLSKFVTAGKNYNSEEVFNSSKILIRIFYKGDFMIIEFK